MPVVYTMQPVTIAGEVQQDGNDVVFIIRVSGAPSMGVAALASASLLEGMTFAPPAEPPGAGWRPEACGSGDPVVGETVWEWAWRTGVADAGKQPAMEFAPPCWPRDDDGRPLGGSQTWDGTRWW